VIWDAISSILPAAVAVALSPGAIIAVILVLFSNRARLNSTLFLTGWVVGVAAAFALVAAIAGGANTSDPNSGASTGQAIVQILLALLFLGLAVRQWRERPRPGEPERPNPLFDKIPDMAPKFALALGFVSSALNPKNLPIVISAAADAARTDLSNGGLVLVTIVFTAIATLGVAAPVVLSLALGDRATHSLTEMRDWMTAHSAAIMIVLFIVLGAKFLGSGISGLAA
jgi:threonine/homoserine/homoserine lactone efflux protein